MGKFLFLMESFSVQKGMNSLIKRWSHSFLLIHIHVQKRWGTCYIESLESLYFLNSCFTVHEDSDSILLKVPLILIYDMQV